MDLCASTTDCGHVSDVTNIILHGMIRCIPYLDTVNEDFTIGAIHGAGVVNFFSYP